MGSSPSKKCQACHETFTFSKIEEKSPPKECTLCQSYYTNYQDKRSVLEHYGCNDFSPICKSGEDYSSAFVGTTFKFTPKELVFAARVQNTPESIGSFFHKGTTGSFGESLRHDLAISDKDPMFNKMAYDISMAIPKGIYYIEGKAAPLKTDKTWKSGGGDQIYIPKVVASALWELSQRFREKPLTKANIQEYIRETERTIVPIQNIWWKEYETQKKAKHEEARQSNLVFNLRKIVETVKVDEKAEIDKTALNLDKAIREADRILEKEKLTGELEDEVVGIIGRLILIKRIFVIMVKMCTNMGSNFEDIVNYSKVISNPTMGNLYGNECPDEVKRMFENGRGRTETPLSLNKYSFAIHRCKDGKGNGVTIVCNLWLDKIEEKMEGNRKITIYYYLYELRQVGDIMIE